MTRHPSPLQPFLILTFLLALSSSSPISSPDDDPPKAPEVIVPRYYAILNLLWASLNAAQLVVAYKILKQPSLDHRTKGSYWFICAAIAARLGSHLLTAAFAEFDLSSWDLMVIGTGGPRRSSVLGTLAEASSWSVDALLFTGVFKGVHEPDRRQAITFRSLRNPTHETMDHLLLRSLWVCILYISYTSFVHPESSASENIPSYAVHALLLLVLTLDCWWWSVILDKRIKKKGVADPGQFFTKYALVGVFVWVRRCIQKPLPLFIIDAAPQIFIHPLVYSTVFWFVNIVGKGDHHVTYSIAIGVGIVVCFYLVLILYIVFVKMSMP